MLHGDGELPLYPFRIGAPFRKGVSVGDPVLWLIICCDFIHHPALIFSCDGGVEHFAKVLDRKSTRLNSSHVAISYAVFCLKKKKLHTEEFTYLCEREE